MIKVERSGKPEYLQNHADKLLQDYLAARQAYENTPTKSLKKQKDHAENKYRHEDIRDALKEMFQSKCAFCESQIDHISYPHIEHFRPKSQFPEYCFDWENLLLACSICNGSQYKGDRFPLTINGEAMINPCVDDPNDFFDFEFEQDDNNPTGFIAVVRFKNERGEITEQTMGLNRITLIRHRSKYLLPYYPYLAKKAAEGDMEALHLLEKACQPQFAFAAFAQMLWRKFIKI